MGVRRTFRDLLVPTLHCFEMSIDVEAVIAGVTPIKYVAVAALAMLTYDCALTFDDEFEFVWKRSWSVGKVLFIFNRYFGVLSVLSFVMASSFRLSDQVRHYCRGFIWWGIASEAIAIATAESMIYIFYNCSRRLLLVLIAFLVAAMAICSWLAISTLSTMTMKVSGMTACSVTATPHAFFVWIPSLIFETCLVALMSCKGWRVYRSEGGSKLLHLIIRDSMFMAILANCIVWVIPSLDPSIAASWTIAMPCAVGCRLLLNMRESFYKETTSIWTVMSA
ncbi:hypothetical protein JB92DRAFT_2924089 [Gautieria morchelliformis]|nr:hypothetical protein JB92DRAFT_2924089 [Gautieria morchelliformis]